MLSIVFWSLLSSILPLSPSIMGRLRWKSCIASWDYVCWPAGLGNEAVAHLRDVFKLRVWQLVNSVALITNSCLWWISCTWSHCPLEGHNTCDQLGRSPCHLHRKLWGTCVVSEPQDDQCSTGPCTSAMDECLSHCKLTLSSAWRTHPSALRY